MPHSYSERRTLRLRKPVEKSSPNGKHNLLSKPQTQHKYLKSRDRTMVQPHSHASPQCSPIPMGAQRDKGSSQQPTALESIKKSSTKRRSAATRQLLAINHILMMAQPEFVTVIEDDKMGSSWGI